MKKRVLSIAVLLLAALVLSACTTTNTPAATDTPTATETPAATDAPAATDTPAVTEDPAQSEDPASMSGDMTFTADELAKYDGTDGNPAYIAVDGVVYDVTDVPQWREGLHNGFTAGRDLTEEIKTVSPHGLSKLTGLTVVGSYVE